MLHFLRAKEEVRRTPWMEPEAKESGDACVKSHKRSVCREIFVEIISMVSDVVPRVKTPGL